MGAGIEDVIAVKALQYQQVPPIPNLEMPDESAQELRFSSGGSFNGRFAIRFAAGFGSQLVLLAWQRGSNQPDQEKYHAWLQDIAEVNTNPPNSIDSLYGSVGLGSPRCIDFRHDRIVLINRD